MKSVKKIHKVSIEQIRKDYKHTLSSHAFTSFYLWQHAMRLEVKCEEDFFVAKSGIHGKNAWFFPCGNEQKKYDFICEHIEEADFSFAYMRTEDVEWLESKFPDKWEFHHTEESDEYIGNIAEYISLEGSKFSEIRRKIRKIDKEYQIKTALITDKNIIDAMVVVSKWRKVHSACESTSAAFGESSCLEDNNVAEIALSEREFLDVSGIILYANDEPVCVFAGFPLSEDTLDVVIGKAVSDAPKGIAYYGLREYLKLCGTGYTYCNHEEDLGIPGIRQMKNSLCPVFKVSIWEAVLK